MKNAPRKLRIAIIVLIVLLALSLLTLLGVQLYRYLTPPPTGTDKVPDNVIGPTTSVTTGPNETTVPITTEPAPAEPDVTLKLHSGRPEDNRPFELHNMFPGDSETKTFCVRVSYKESVWIRFRTRIHEGYEKLAEVMRCRVVLVNTGEILYDGLMRDVPPTVVHELSSPEPTEEDLYYEITSYLDTSVGNEYMRRSLVVDFCWDAMDDENLIPPQTGDDFNIVLWVGVAVCSGVLLILLVISRRKKKEEQDGK